VLEERARVEMLMGDYRKTLATVTQALEEARAVGAELTEVKALITLGFTRAGLGDEAEGIATMREAYARAGAIASPADRGRAAANLSELLDLTGRTEEGLALAREELAEARKRPERTSFDAFLAVQESYLLARLGRLADARAALPARIPGEAISYAGIYWRYMRAWLALVEADLAAAGGELAELCRLSENAAEPQWIEPRTEIEVELALRSDRIDDARAILLRAAPRIVHSDEVTRLSRMCWMTQRVEAEAAGRARALGEPYEPALDATAAVLRDRGARTRHDEACAWGDMAAAELARRRTLLGDAPADPAPWEEAARAFDAIGLPLPAAYARFRAGEAHVTAGDRAAAAVPLRAARPARGRHRRARAGGAGRLARRSPRAHAARARGADAGRRGPHEPGDRRDAVHEREDRLGACLADPRQARRRRPRRGRRGRPPARAGRRRARLRASGTERARGREQHLGARAHAVELDPLLDRVRPAAVGPEHDGGDAGRGDERGVHPGAVAADGRLAAEQRRRARVHERDDRLVRRDLERRADERRPAAQLGTGIAGGDEPRQLAVELLHALARQRAALDRQHAALGVAG
jgi:hypothetical protein